MIFEIFLWVLGLKSKIMDFQRHDFEPFSLLTQSQGWVVVQRIWPRSCTDLAYNKVCFKLHTFCCSQLLYQFAWKYPAHILWQAKYKTVVFLVVF
jgi:hypothetical protein